VTNPIGPLTPQDEGFNHQIIDTFAVVSQGDLAWTEKVCAMAAARDGSLQLGFGLGKYNNRNVMDAYAGISRGVEQITVRSSRALGADPNTTVIGPIRYEIVEPLHSVRFVLEPNDVQPIAFDCLFEAAFPPAFEDRTHIRSRNRVAAELIRYHQIGRCSGWVEVDGERTELTPETWVSTRDHSWGVRYCVGLPMEGLEPQAGSDAYHFFWTPSYLERGDGTAYGLSSSVCTNRLDYITRFVSELQVGSVNVREVPGFRLELTPFGGIKDSGLGYKEGVQEAMKSFTNLKTYSLPWP